MISSPKKIKCYAGWSWTWDQETKILRTERSRPLTVHVQGRCVNSLLLLSNRETGASCYYNYTLCKPFTGSDQKPQFSFSKQILMIQFQVILYLVPFQSKEFSWKQQGIKTLKSCFVRRKLGGIKRLAENIIINWRYLHYDVQSNMGIILCLGTNLWSLIFVSQDEFMNCYIQTKAFKNNSPFILLFNFRCFQNKNFNSFIQFQFFSF